MIRLLALKELMKNVTVTEANMLACSSTAYCSMLSKLPYILPRRRWEDLLQAQLLSGMTSTQINSRLTEPVNKMKLSRIRRYPLMPEAEYIKEPNRILTQEITQAKQFYYGILKPLQFKEYELEDTYIKWFQIQMICRTAPLGLIYIHNEQVKAMLTIMQSLPAPSKGYFFQKYGSSSHICKIANATASNAKNYAVHDDSKCDRYVSEYEATINYVYDLLYRVRTVGIINDNLMEAVYEYPFTRP